MRTAGKYCIIKLVYSNALSGGLPNYQERGHRQGGDVFAVSEE